jgi:hypothetical protein
MNVGSLTFDDDKLWTPLQAADVIAWASRVKAQGDQLTNGYEPLTGLFDEAHIQEPYPEKSMDEFATRIDEIRLNSEFPL